MDKVKIFTRGTSDKFQELEDEINKWIQGLGGDAEVISVEIATAAGVNNIGESFVNCTALVHYDDGND